MNILIYVCFGLGIALTVSSAVVALYYARGAGEAQLLRLASRLSLGGGLLMLATLGIRMAVWQRVPLTSGVESLMLFIAVIAIASFVLSQQEKRHTLLLLYLPPLALIAVVAAATASPDLSTSPKDLSAALLLFHVVPAFVAYGLLILAGLTGVAYVFQARQLKARRSAGLGHKLPSLENLDRTLYQLIMLGYPLFVITLGMGFYWAWYDRELLGDMWWISPKIVLSLVMVLLYAIAFHGRALGLLRGPKLAYTLCIGVGAIIGVYLCLALLRLGDYQFWVDPS